MLEYHEGEIITQNGHKWIVKDVTPSGSILVERYFWFDSVLDWMRRKLG